MTDNVIAMRHEADEIARRRGDAILAHPASQDPASAAPAVIISLPGNLSSNGIEVLVRHERHGVFVEVRPALSGGPWTPLYLVGGDFEVRPA